MNWQKYEEEIHSYFSQLYPGANITYDAKTIGRYSKKSRQIDVLIEDDVAGIPIRLIVDAKYFSRKIDVKSVESFIAMMEDVDAHQGLLITSKGFSEAAINRAYYGPSKLELDILNFDELLRNQGLVAIPYAGDSSLLISAPFGWIIDNSRVHYSLACLYQRGRTLKKAQAHDEWMYLNFWVKTNEIKDIDDLVLFQNERMESRYHNLKIDYLRAPERADGLVTKIRAAVADELPCQEITGFIDCGKFIAFFVLFTVEQFKNENLRKLAHVLKYSEPVKMNFNNVAVIEQLKERSKSMTTQKDRSNAYWQIAVWYAEMEDEVNALKYHRLSYSTYPRNYANLKSLIRAELSSGSPDKARKCSLILFKMDPTNPTVMQNLLEFYRWDDYAGHLANVVDDLLSEFRDNVEALGNIEVHYGMYLHAKNDDDMALSYLKSAKDHFEIAFDKNHYVIDQIKDILKKYL